MSGDDITRWTIRMALAALLARFAADLCFARSASRDSFARWSWTVGCLFLWIHVACAFEFFHQRSHALAMAHTARRTVDVVGLDWGGGIWFNYLLMLLWLADVAWWWLFPASFQARPRWLDRAWHACVLFIAFNATVVFEEGPIRIAGIASSMALLAAFAFRFLRTSSEKGAAA